MKSPMTSYVKITTPSKSEASYLYGVIYSKGMRNAKISTDDPCVIIIEPSLGMIADYLYDRIILDPILHNPKNTIELVR